MKISDAALPVLLIVILLANVNVAKLKTKHGGNSHTEPHEYVIHHHKYAPQELHTQSKEQHEHGQKLGNIGSGKLATIHQYEQYSHQNRHHSQQEHQKQYQYQQNNNASTFREKRVAKNLERCMQKFLKPTQKKFEIRVPRKAKATHKRHNHRPQYETKTTCTYEETHEHIDDDADMSSIDGGGGMRETDAKDQQTLEASEDYEVHTEPQHEQSSSAGHYYHEHQKEEKIKIKHHHHHHHHNHVKEIIKKVPEPYPVEKIVHVPVEKVVEKVVHVPKPVPVEKIVKVPVETVLHVPKPYPVEKIVEKKVPVEKVIHVPITQIVEKIIHVPKPYPVEKVIEKVVHVPKQVTVEKVVHVPKPYPVIKPVPYPVEVMVPVYVEKMVPVPYKGAKETEKEKRATNEKKMLTYRKTHEPYKFELPRQYAAEQQERFLYGKIHRHEDQQLHQQQQQQQHYQLQEQLYQQQQQQQQHYHQQQQQQNEHEFQQQQLQQHHHHQLQNIKHQPHEHQNDLYEFASNLRPNLARQPQQQQQLPYPHAIQTPQAHTITQQQPLSSSQQHQQFTTKLTRITNDSENANTPHPLLPIPARLIQQKSQNTPQHLTVFPIEPATLESKHSTQEFNVEPPPAALFKIHVSDTVPAEEGGLETAASTNVGWREFHAPLQPQPQAQALTQMQPFSNSLQVLTQMVPISFPFQFSPAQPMPFQHRTADVEDRNGAE